MQITYKHTIIDHHGHLMHIVKMRANGKTVKTERGSSHMAAIKKLAKYEDRMREAEAE